MFQFKIQSLFYNIKGSEGNTIDRLLMWYAEYEEPDADRDQAES